MDKCGRAAAGNCNPGALAEKAAGNGEAYARSRAADDNFLAGEMEIQNEGSCFLRGPAAYKTSLAIWFRVVQMKSIRASSILIMTGRAMEHSRTSADADQVSITRPA